MSHKGRTLSVGKLGSSASRKKYNASRMRAGKRKCRRCKLIFYKEKGTKCVLCLRCTEHCSRCDCLLTKDNKSLKQRHVRCKPCNAELVDLDSSRDRRLIRVYGITLPEYEAIMKLQKGVCWICKKPPKKGGHRLSVDHLHSIGERKRNPREIRGRVRGLLCWRCNNAIEKFKDQSTLLRRAAEYLEVWPAQEILKEKTNGS